VSHDRAFLNEVSTSLLVFEGPPSLPGSSGAASEGRITEYIGGYDDWQAAAAAAVKPVAPPPTKIEPKRADPSPKETPRPRKLTNRERAEIEALPKKIEALEAEQATLTAKLADPVFFKTAGAEVGTATRRLQEIEAEVAAAYERWGELE
jgi:ATP-binding cassette subfamily F protein uup